MLYQTGSAFQATLLLVICYVAISRYIATSATSRHSRYFSLFLATLATLATSAISRYFRYFRYFRYSRYIAISRYFSLLSLLLAIVAFSRYSRYVAISRIGSSVLGPNAIGRSEHRSASLQSFGSLKLGSDLASSLWVRFLDFD